MWKRKPVPAKPSWSEPGAQAINLSAQVIAGKITQQQAIQTLIDAKGGRRRG